MNMQNQFRNIIFCNLKSSLWCSGYLSKFAVCDWLVSTAETLAWHCGGILLHNTSTIDVNNFICRADCWHVFKSLATTTDLHKMLWIITCKNDNQSIKAVVYECNNCFIFSRVWQRASDAGREIPLRERESANASFQCRHSAAARGEAPGGRVLE